MVAMMASFTATRAFDAGLVLTALGFGFRHGIDWDHIAALTDITSSQTNPRRSMVFSAFYALGHALVVFALGIAAIVFATRVPRAVDAMMERIVGTTLVVLAIWVLYGLARQGRAFRMRSRWMLLLASVRSSRRWMRRDCHRHTHRDRMPEDPFVDYAPRTAFGIGMIHGIGAETPTQLLIFLTAAGAGGKGVGLLLLVCFVAGLLASNTAIALAGTFGFLGAARNFGLYAAISLVTAAFSLAIGTIFLLGNATAMPSMLGG